MKTVTTITLPNELLLLIFQYLSPYRYGPHSLHQSRNQHSSDRYPDDISDLDRRLLRTTRQVGELRDLYHCMMVCRQWLACARMYLWETPFLSDAPRNYLPQLYGMVQEKQQ